MAFLVCYSRSLSDHVKNTAVYLDQQFYELIFRHCRSESSGFNMLRQIALLRYKSPTILLPNEQLGALTSELEKLQNANLRHAQLDSFKKVCSVAVKNESGLTISGDMYPELDDRLF